MREGITTIESDGSVELPKTYLEKHHLKPGSTVHLEERGEELVIKPEEPEEDAKWRSLSDLAGILAGTNAVEELLAERRADAMREDDKFRPR